MLTVQEARPDHRLRPFLRSYVQRESHLKGKAVDRVVAQLGAVLKFRTCRNTGVSASIDLLRSSVGRGCVGGLQAGWGCESPGLKPVLWVALIHGPDVGAKK